MDRVCENCVRWSVEDREENIGACDLDSLGVTFGDESCPEFAEQCKSFYPLSVFDSLDIDPMCSACIYYSDEEGLCATPLPVWAGVEPFPMDPNSDASKCRRFMRRLP